MTDKFYHILQQSELFFQNYAQRGLSGGLRDEPGSSLDQKQRREINEELTKREEAERILEEERIRREETERIPEEEIRRREEAERAEEEGRIKREETERILGEEIRRREEAERAVEEERARRGNAEERVAQFETLEARRQNRKSSRVKKFFSKFKKNK